MSSAARAAVGAAWRTEKAEQSRRSGEDQGERALTPPKTRKKRKTAQISGNSFQLATERLARAGRRPARATVYSIGNEIGRAKQSDARTAPGGGGVRDPGTRGRRQKGRSDLTITPAGRVEMI